jgi:hypothetical protein
MLRAPLALLALSGGSVGAAPAPEAITGTFAIQNVQTGKNLRPFEARKDDGNKVILYDHHWWKCLTWDFQRVAGNLYQLRNFYTGKALQPAGKAVAGATLQQQPMSGADIQQWEFLAQPGSAYLIRHKGSGLYITVSSPETNSAIDLRPRQQGNAQLWRLVAQKPWF